MVSRNRSVFGLTTNPRGTRQVIPARRLDEKQAEDQTFLELPLRMRGWCDGVELVHLRSPLKANIVPKRCPDSQVPNVAKTSS